ncbi:MULTISPECIES: beta-Ig-H3/fasciclin [unclassified Streptomyces]|uniref:beta-Ig-H3/fasciclin n=1 Tax=unclassified Streptomyces TaxID=2593676 RepID=UPI00234BD14C|nr:beta-Ig-H3/fasciclin [Streptomyces sp. M92]WCN01792.1 beta-Ig-H3/fasciclin [Streptomyces sp. M92]
MAATVAAIGGSFFVSAPAAHAAAAGTAPACVNRYVTNTPNGFDVNLTNKCGRTMRVKVIVNNGGDSPCYTIYDRRSKLFIYEGVFGTYDRTVTC